MKKQTYDNSNIAESYSGVTTPLTASFIQHNYQEVYKHFCIFMGVNKATVARNNSLFTQMVVSIGNHIYYNLTNWHKMISLFPAYKYSARFMDRMMGVKEEYRLTSESPGSLLKKYFYHLPHTVIKSLTVIFNFLLMGSIIRRFNTYFDKKIKRYNAIDLSRSSLPELRQIYDAAYSDFMKKWRGPIANDFAVMVSTGLTEMLFKKWNKASNAFQLMRLSNKQSTISLDPGKHMIKLINMVTGDRRLAELFGSSLSDKEVYQALTDKHAESFTAKAVKEYLEVFGARFPNELKLESIRLTERPEWVISLIRAGANNSPYSSNGDAEGVQDVMLNDVTTIQKVMLKSLLAWSSKSIERREESRWRRMLLFDFVRKLFLAFGTRLVYEGKLNETNDIYYCSVEEVFSLAAGKTIDQLSNTIADRKEKLMEWQHISMPSRIESDKDIGQIERELLQSVDYEDIQEQHLTGTVASRPSDMQTLNGIALTLDAFDEKADYNGKILIAKHTDPGWTVIFPLLKGIIVERGGQLSHAAVVAREFNIPCIVGATNATRHLPTNIQVGMDLMTGAITKS